jgi:hypothetical protein
MKDISTLLGKPSHQTKETSGGVVSTDSIYPDLGLMARVTSDMNACQMLVIDTSGKFIEEIATMNKIQIANAQKYSGALSPALDGTWKLQSVMAQFKGNKQSLNERDKSFAVEFKTHSIIFFFNKETELLGGITLIRNAPIKFNFR